MASEVVWVGCHSMQVMRRLNRDVVRWSLYVARERRKGCGRHWSNKTQKDLQFSNCAVSVCFANLMQKVLLWKCPYLSHLWMKTLSQTTFVDKMQDTLASISIMNSRLVGTWKGQTLVIKALNNASDVIWQNVTRQTCFEWCAPFHRIQRLFGGRSPSFPIVFFWLGCIHDCLGLCHLTCESQGSYWQLFCKALMHFDLTLAS